VRTQLSISRRTILTVFVIRNVDNTHRGRQVNKMDKKNISNQVGYAAVYTADQLGAKAIIAPSITGFTTRMLSKWRSSIPVYGMSPSISTVRQMQLFYGVVPVWAKRADTKYRLGKHDKFMNSYDLHLTKKYLKSRYLKSINARYHYYIQQWFCLMRRNLLWLY